MRKKTIVFIIGTGRNGSTLLDMALNSHSEIFSVGELSSFSQDLEVKTSLCGCYNTFSQCRFWNKIIDEVNEERNVDIRKNYHAFNTILPVSYVDKCTNFKFRFLFLLALFKIRKFSLKPSDHIVDNLCMLYQKVFKSGDMKIISDSYKNVRRAVIISSAFRKDFNFKFIHLLRDGRAVLNSYMKTNYKVYTINSKKLKATTIPLNPQEPEKIVKYWKKVNLESLVFLKFSRRQCYKILKYEDLCNRVVAQ